MITGACITIPGALVWHGASPLVTLGEVRADALTAPFVDDALLSLAPRRLCALDALKEPDADDDLGLAGSVFHMSRCGSTLMARQFQTVDRVAVLSEPFVFQHLLEGPPAPAPLVRRRIRTLLGLWRDGLKPVADRLVVKWPLVVGHHAAAIADALPDSPLTFLHRDPVEILVSLSREGHGGIERARPVHVGLPDDARVSGDCPLRTSAKAIAVACDAVAGVSSVRTLDYRLLPAATAALVSAFFGLRADPAAMSNVSATYSKDATKSRVFRPDSAAKRSAADATIRSLAADIVGPALRRTLAALQPLAPGDARYA